MRTFTRLDTRGFLRPGTRRTLAMLFAALLAGCAANSTDVIEGNTFGRVTLRPGATANCIGSPCEVYFEMPAGSGDYVVTGNQVKLGEYPAGKTVFLGSFYPSQIVIKVLGSDVALAYVTIGGMD